jgi:SulP family sulfate permease
VLDSTASTTIEGFVHKARAHGAIVYVTGARSPMRRSLFTHGVRPPYVRFKAAVGDAVNAAQAEIARSVAQAELTIHAPASH